MRIKMRAKKFKGKQRTVMFQAEPESGTAYPRNYHDESPMPGSPSPVSPSKRHVKKVLNLENL
tara:strand:+ start:122 stop:310 length:189 start_codon:yes stop_codon:yes gene_type:complete